MTGSPEASHGREASLRLKVLTFTSFSLHFTQTETPTNRSSFPTFIPAIPQAIEEPS